MQESIYSCTRVPTKHKQIKLTKTQLEINISK